MAEIKPNQLTEFMHKPGALAGSPVCLIHGEPMLVEQCVEPLIDGLLQGAARQINCEVLDGAVENIPEILERLNTYALTAGPRIVWFKEARLFDSGGNQQRLVDKIREAYESDQLEPAAKGFLNFCTKQGADPLSAGLSQTAELELLQDAIGADGIQRLSAYCRDNGWRAAASDDYLQMLEQAIQKGFPAGHHLVVTAAARVPKNRKFYKTIQAHGLVIDCNVPLGERRADKMAQETVLRQILEACLKKAGKRMPPALFGTLIQLTGFNPATFRDNIEKLIDYIGPRNEITAPDVEAVIRRTKSDPLFELTNAVADRHLINALFYLETLLASGWHALQILAALANQIRKLIVARDFTMSAHGQGRWRPGMAYPQFQTAVLPAVKAYDDELSGRVGRWTPPAGNKQAPKSKKDRADMALASTSGSAYPVYQTLLKCENYRLDELEKAMIELNLADLRLKSTGQDPVLVMKRLLLSICGGVR